MTHLYDTGCACVRCEAESKLRASAVAPTDSMDDELNALRSVVKALEPLDYEARVRVMDWLRSRFDGRNTVGLIGMAQGGLTGKGPR